MSWFPSVYVGRLTDENDFSVSLRIPFYFSSSSFHFCAASDASSVHSAIQLIYWDKTAVTFNHYMNCRERTKGCRWINCYYGNSLLGITFYKVQIILLCFLHTTFTCPLPVFSLHSFRHNINPFINAKGCHPHSLDEETETQDIKWIVQIHIS